MRSVAFMSFRVRRSGAPRWLLATIGVLMFSACTPTIRRAPPVEDRSVRSPAASAAAAAQPVESAPLADAAKVLPGAENAGKPGYYSVKPGDTMIRIGLEAGQSWRDIARWNGMDNPNLIEVGQVLRVLPPGVDPAVAASKGVSSAKVEARALEGRSGQAASAPPPPALAIPPAPPAGGATAAVVATGAVPPGVAAAAPTAPPAASATPPATATAPPAAAAALPKGEDEPAWVWPASGPVLAAFDDARQKGLAIGGKSGDAVLAAADGRVVYAGSGLRGYGNLLIVKHNATYLSAYAHNQTLLVKEDQSVRRGQKIAEMGATGAEQVQLHFEIRRLGKPVDPARLLPPR